MKGHKNILKSWTTCWRLEDGKIESPRLPEWLPHPYSFKDSDRNQVKEYTDKELSEITLINYVWFIGIRVNLWIIITLGLHSLIVKNS